MDDRMINSKAASTSITAVCCSGVPNLTAALSPFRAPLSRQIDAVSYTTR